MAKLSYRRTGWQVTVRFFGWQCTADHRFWIIFLLWLLVIAITFVAAYVMEPELEKYKHEVWRSAYASWVTAVVFFTLIGFAIAALGFKRPEAEDYDRRVQILFSGIQGWPIPEIADQIKQFAIYVERANRQLTIRRYSSDLNAYFIEVETSYNFHNILDQPVTDDIRIGVTPDKFEHPPAELGQIRSIWFKEEILQAPYRFVSDDPFTRLVPITLQPNERERMIIKYELWGRTGEEHFMTPQRHIAEFEMEIRSECEEGVPQIQRDDQATPMLLPYGERKLFPKLRQVSAGQRIFRFHLLPPLEQ